MIHADGSELRDLERDLDRARRDLMPEVVRVTSKGALNIKTEWKRRWEGHPKIKHIPPTIGYDLDSGDDWAEAVIGPDKDRPGPGAQAEISHIIDFGSVNNAPIPGGQPALDGEEENYVRALADAAERAFGGRRVG